MSGYAGLTRPTLSVRDGIAIAGDAIDPLLTRVARGGKLAALVLATDLMALSEPLDRS